MSAYNINVFTGPGGHILRLVTMEIYTVFSKNIYSNLYIKLFNSFTSNFLVLISKTSSENLTLDGLLKPKFESSASVAAENPVPVLAAIAFFLKLFIDVLKVLFTAKYSLIFLLAEKVVTFINFLGVGLSGLKFKVNFRSSKTWTSSSEFSKRLEEEVVFEFEFEVEFSVIYPKSSSSSKFDSTSLSSSFLFVDLEVSLSFSFKDKN